jgi:mRNA interferase RelE/StbE
VVKTIAYTVSARRALRKLPSSTRGQIEAKLAHYAHTGGGDVKTLTGSSGARLRVGDWRVIFIETKTTIEVRAVGHRREIYR